MKKKYAKPVSSIYTCDIENSLMAGSAGSIPVGGTGTKPRYVPRSNDDYGHSNVFDEPDYENVRIDDLE